ncbi:WcaI family glycosyltransferase [Paraburkholderia sp. 1N]|uniref:WcaI family glycosyltransferase n=1 Tax=Paraburkholderia solitsugae TaxID=2675748 RepID=A0ABX2BIA2_9BURK|nr:glycosyltransferase WbuB [Paraburkholderia solitsugae]NPT40349.1 WcaI family glycosyltransferase [Paraburkholderia solitsugae]
MKILLYGINYAPELTGIGKYSSEMAESLRALGHDVRVVCAPPYYPEWRVAKSYSAWRYTGEWLSGIRVWRAPLWIPARPRGAVRLLHLVSFAVASAPIMLMQALWRPDVVLTIAPSLLNAPVAWLLARLTFCKALLHVQDFEVDAAFQLGLLKGKRLKRAALSIERFMMRRFDLVSTISGRMVEHASSKGLDRAKVFCFPNWVDTKAVSPIDRPSEFRALWNISQSATVVLYSGNMGAKQGIEVLAEAASALSGRQDIVFVFCGDGPSRAPLEMRCAGLPNVKFVPLQPVDRLNELLNLADIHVLPQRADAADLVMPSKLTGMLASGRATIAMANEGTELFEVVSPRGVVVPPEDMEPLVQAIKTLADDPRRRAHLGATAREYAEAKLSRQMVLGEFEENLRRLCEGDKSCETNEPQDLSTIVSPSKGHDSQRFNADKQKTDCHNTA